MKRIHADRKKPAQAPAAVLPVADYENAAPKHPLNEAAFSISFAATLALAAANGCGARDSDRAAATAHAPGDVRVVAIERVHGDLARQLGGEGFDVTTILDSPSADPHAYEPTPRDADAIAGADIVVENGLGYDAFTDKSIAASPRAGRVVVIAGTLGDHRLGDNPHVWYEVRSLRRTSDALARELAKRMETLPAGEKTQAWIDREVASLERAL